MKKQDILDAIQRTAKANDGKPLGLNTFFQETGIKREDWMGKFWVRWGDAVREAGFDPNSLQIPYGTDILILKLVELTRELGHIPIKGELQLKANTSEDFPVYQTLSKNLGSKKSWVAKIAAYCQTHPGYDDVLALCANQESSTEPEEIEPEVETGDGWVYLLKSGQFYKIGRTNDLARRHGQLTIQLPQSLEIIHQIRTDDPAGIEAYWHRRFEAKRKEGEWFQLNSQDVRTFKKRKTFM